MSKYTTEVRYICEKLAGYDESQEGNDVDTVIANSWEKIFTTGVQTWDETYKSVICQKLLKHYYFNEIGFETVGLWKARMNTKFEELVPFYNRLWEAESVKFNPLWDTNLTRETNRTDASQKTENTTSKNTDKKTGTDTLGVNRSNSSNFTDSVTNTNTGTSTLTKNNTNTNLFSETPQGALTGVLNKNYLTDARQVTDDGTDTTNVNNSDTGKTIHDGVDTVEGTDTTTYNTTNTRDITTNNTGNINSTQKWVETITGKNSGKSISAMLVEFREAIANVDMMFIEEFNDCFMLLW